ncbi:hypothetical protein [Deinococcus radiotolerans]|uniref:Uncharacterized protein n=1 Tax=Deinococcus radiotolerans TaxID=1309407 RepID=A0ABQ2FCR8_9DEIO|nr:hypothetical protein [Deinococcus radiotolerans]GGK85644.1 hypothetical protein GCM10010844_00190 [Deinococcus radiotolerans]
MNSAQDSYTLAEVAFPSTSALPPGRQVLLLVVSDTVEDLVWAQVEEGLPASVHRAQIVQASGCFPDLPAGSEIYFRPEHVLQDRAGGPYGRWSAPGALTA